MHFYHLLVKMSELYLELLMNLVLDKLLVSSKANTS